MSAGRHMVHLCWICVCKCMCVQYVWPMFYLWGVLELFGVYSKKGNKYERIQK